MTYIGNKKTMSQRQESRITGGILTLLSIALPLSHWAAPAWAQEKVTKYTYDALGRLTFVEDTVNGNRDYDYDKAGNRLQVTVTGGTDQGTEPPPPQPIPAPVVTQVFLSSQCSWRVVWQPVADATKYTIRDYSGYILEHFTGTQGDYSFCGVSGYSGDPQHYRPKWIQACRGVPCGTKTDLP